MTWTVKISRKTAKQVDCLPQEIRKRFYALAQNIKHNGPVQSRLPNYGKIAGARDCHHCHIKKGKPTYVVVWKVINKEVRIVEVAYVGTHEKANYGTLCRDSR